MHDDRELDELLDRALTSYVDQEPEPSLRGRIYARTIETARPIRRWLLGTAAACAAALLVAFLLHPATHSSLPELPAPSVHTSSASTPESPASITTSPQQMGHPHAVLTAHRIRRNERPALARSASFPSPSPLTAEESILLNFAAKHPEQARQILAAPATGPIENAPLAIAPIHIAALSETQQTQQWQ
jgi:hypothetical protein